MPKTTTIPDGVHRCCRCGKQLSDKESYKSYSDLFLELGRFPVCKECLNEIFDEYSARYSSQKVGMQRLCMAFDIYYNEALYETCASDVTNVLGNYLKKFNLSNYRNKTFDDTLKEGFSFGLEKGKKKKKGQEEPEIGDIADSEDIDRWGEGLSLADYRELNKHYKKLKKQNPNCDSNQEIFIDELCYIKMLQMRAVREFKTDDVARMSEQYRKTFEKAGLKTVRDASEAESFSFGVGIEEIEKHTPAEYYKNKNLYKDFDNIGDYFTRFVLRPILNQQFGTTDRDHEFYIVDDESEVDDGGDI